tara:strand:- start:489 stop:3473 length:2985 start_codon:yes stop_codon:yes gene_type:complete
MALERGQQLSRGSRRTQVESSFGVVKTQANTLGTSLSNLTQTVDKVNQFQVDIMDKEWQNDFDTNSALFIENETRKELNSTNPDIVGLREKFISYRNTSLERAPKRFSNYIENKLDINYATQINNVKDYANDLRFNNLVTSNDNLNELNLNTTANLIEKIIADNPGDLEKQRQLIDLEYLQNVTSNLITQENGNELLHTLKPLEVTKGLIAKDLRNQMLNYETLNQSAVIKGIMSKTNFESGEIANMSLQLKDTEIEIDNYIEDYMKNPDIRRVKDLSPEEVTTLASNLKTVKNNLLSVQSDKINKIQAVDNYNTNQIANQYPLQYVANSYLSLESTEGTIMKDLLNDPVVGELVSKQPALFTKIVNESLKAVTVHKFLDKERGKPGSDNNYLPNKNDIIARLKENKGIVLTLDELDDYVYANIGGSINLTAEQFVENMVRLENSNDMTYGNQIKGSPNIQKSQTQLQKEQNNILNYQAIKSNIQNGYLPSGTKDMIANVDSIMSQTNITDTQLNQLRNTIDFLNLIQGENPDILFEQYIDTKLPTFLNFVKNTRKNYSGLNIVDIDGGRALQAEYRDFIKKPYDLETVSTVIKDIGLGSENLELKVIQDLKSQMGTDSFLKWMSNKLPNLTISLPFGEQLEELGIINKDKKWNLIGTSDENKWSKTDNYSEVLGNNIPTWKKILVGFSGLVTNNLFIPSFGGLLTKEKDKDFGIVIPVNIKEQWNDTYTLKLKDLGVDFSIAETNEEEFKKQILKILPGGETIQEKAMTLTAKEFDRNDFSMSSYEQMGNGVKLVHNSIEGKIPYDSKIEKDIYVAAHFYQRIKFMENDPKIGIDKMKDTYPELYHSNWGTNKENKVKFDIKRAYQLAIEDNGLYFIKQPGTNAYSYNLNPEVFAGSQAFNLAGDIDDPQFFEVTDVMVTNDDQLISRPAIVGEAIQTYIRKNSNIVKFMKSQDIDSETMENLLYAIYYPGVRALTTKTDILNYIEENGFNLE